MSFLRLTLLVTFSFWMLYSFCSQDILFYVVPITFCPQLFFSWERRWIKIYSWWHCLNTWILPCLKPTLGFFFSYTSQRVFLFLKLVLVGFLRLANGAEHSSEISSFDDASPSDTVAGITNYSTNYIHILKERLAEARSVINEEPSKNWQLLRCSTQRNCLSTHRNSKVSFGAGSMLSQMGLCHLNTPTTTRMKMGILYLQYFAKIQYIIGFDISQIIFEFLE